jgi:Phage integrase, N-terminal SAM-like domain
MAFFQRTNKEKTMTQNVTPAKSAPSKFLTQLAQAAQRHGHSDETAQAIADWCRRFILFHGAKHPQEMGQAEIAAFLEHVSATEPDALRAIGVARGALEFLYVRYLQRNVGELPWPRPPRLLDQVRQVMRVKHYAQRTEECYTQWIKGHLGHSEFFSRTGNIVQWKRTLNVPNGRRMGPHSGFFSTNRKYRSTEENPECPRFT